MNIGQAIVIIRKARKMTQKELAERCGMSQNAHVTIDPEEMKEFGIIIKTKED